jgi:hypothetical protein
MLAQATTPQHKSRSVTIPSTSGSYLSKTTGIVPTPCLFIRSAAVRAVSSGSAAGNPFSTSNLLSTWLNVWYIPTSHAVKPVTSCGDIDHKGQVVRLKAASRRSTETSAGSQLTKADRSRGRQVSVWAGWRTGSAASWNFCSFRKHLARL